MKFVNAREFNTLFPQYFDNRKKEKEWEDYKRMIKKLLSEYTISYSNLLMRQCCCKSTQKTTKNTSYHNKKLAKKLQCK